MTTIADSMRPNRSRAKRWFTMLGLLLVAGVAMLALAARARVRASAAGSTPSAPPPAPRVRTERVREAEVPITLRLPGTLKGNQEAALAANASGRVIATLVERGSKVKAGQVLAKLDVTEVALSAQQARAEAESAEVQAEQAKIECERYAKLMASGSVSDAEYQQRLTQCRVLPLTARAAKTRASLAVKNVGDGVIRAPFAGVVTERHVEVGQFVREDTRIVTLVSLEQLRLEFAIPEADIAKVHEGMEVGFSVAAYPGRTFRGSVRFISGAVRPATRDLTIEALVDNPDGALKSGMFADVGLATSTRRLPVLPRSAVLERDGRAHAFFAVDGRLEERVLSLGPALETDHSVEKGAKVGDAVALGELSTLSNGQRVQADNTEN